jgi:large subunit ribosomal protein L18
MPTRTRTANRRELHKRIRKKVSGTPQRPRLCVFFSGKHSYAQVIDDTTGRTLVSAATTEKELKSPKNLANQQTAARLGAIIAERALAANIASVVFDRAGFRYHGKVKALADAAREKGLNF